jgi:hypothetical protein
MNRRWLLNISLLVIIAVLAVIALWRPGIEKPAAKPPLTVIKTADIKRIAITRTNTRGIVLQRSDGNWKMVKPGTGRTNPFVVNDVLRILNARNQQALPPDAMQQLNRFGLDRPRARLQLDQLEILFGDSNPVNNLQYVLVQDRIAMIDTSYFWAVARTYTDFLSKRLIEIDRKPVALSLPGYRLSLEKGTWQTYPQQKDLSADRIKQLVDEWHYAQALSVKKYGNGSVINWVRMSFAANNNVQSAKPLRIGIISMQPELILYRPDEQLQYHFPEDIGKRLFNLKQ